MQHNQRGVQFCECRTHSVGFVGTLLFQVALNKAHGSPHYRSQLSLSSSAIDRPTRKCENCMDF